MPKYFAYGSNLSCARLIARVGELVVVGPARAPGFAHAFAKLGVDGTGKGALLRRAGAEAFGVVYELSHGQFARLAGIEIGYRRANITVIPLESSAPSQAETFLPLDRGSAPPPSPAYVRHYEVGFREHGIPEAYVKRVLGSWCPVKRS